MKKLSIVLTLVLCASAFFCVPASAAADEARLYVKAHGTEVTVTVKTNNALGALQGAVKYTDGAFEYDDAAAAEAILANNAKASSFQNVTGATKLALVGDPTNGTSGEWATVTYSAEEGTALNFEFANIKAFDASGDVLQPTAKVILPGDVDNDKTVTIKDYVRLKRYYCSGTAISSQVENKDVDTNGSYQANFDIPQLRKDLIGL